MPLEYRVGWAGAPLAGAGVSVFHARTDGVATTGAAAQAFADRVRTFFDGIKSVVPTGVTWTFPTEVLEIETSTGVLNQFHQVTTPLVVSSSNASTTFAKPAGGRVDWVTSAVVAGKRLKGRTFVVPMGGNQFDASGSLSSSALGTLNTAASTYRSTGVFTTATPVVWSRTHGVLADIVQSVVVDRSTILRSRRD